jgi:hypothetical protein
MKAKARWQTNPDASMERQERWARAERDTWETHKD